LVDVEEAVRSLGVGTSKRFGPAHLTTPWPLDAVLVYIIVVEPKMSSPNPHASKSGLEQKVHEKNLTGSLVMY